MPRIDTGNGSEAFDDFVAEKQEYNEFLRALSSGDFNPLSTIFLSITDTDPRQAEIRSAAREGLFAALQDGEMDKAKTIQDQFPLEAEELQEIATRAVQALVAKAHFNKAKEVVSFAHLPDTLLDTPEVAEKKIKRALQLGWDFSQVKTLLEQVAGDRKSGITPEIQSAGHAWLEKRLSFLGESEVQEIDPIVKLLQIEPEELKAIAIRALGRAREQARSRRFNEPNHSTLLIKTFSIEPSPEEKATVQQVIELLQTRKEKAALRVAREKKLPEDLMTPEIWEAAEKGIMFSMDHGDMETVDEIIKQFRMPYKESAAAMEEAFKRLLVTDLDTAQVVAKKLRKEEEFTAAVKERIRDNLERDNVEIAERMARRFKIPYETI